jgi:hypothetical protein
MFGEIEFFTQSSRELNAKSKNVVHLAYIDLIDFREIL